MPVLGRILRFLEVEKAFCRIQLGRQGIISGLRGWSQMEKDTKVRFKADPE